MSKLRQYYGEVLVELRKATWPWDPKERGAKRYKEITDSTIVVIVAMLLLGGYVSLWDLGLNWFVGLLTR